jgi:hypothetical protein
MKGEPNGGDRSRLSRSGSRQQIKKQSFVPKRPERKQSDRSELARDCRRKGELHGRSLAAGFSSLARRPFLFVVGLCALTNCPRDNA